MRRIFGQHDATIRFDWGEDGLGALVDDCAVLIIVDVLTFSTTVDIAVGHGTRVRPARWRPGSTQSRSTEAAVAGGHEIVLASPNGAALSVLSSDSDAVVLTGCLRNASAVAEAARDLAAGGAIGVIAAGERWGVNLHAHDGPARLRPCVADHLGAGAIVAKLRESAAPSPEAALAADAYCATDVDAAIRDCVSGRELTAHGHAADVDLAVRVDISRSVPRLVNETYCDLRHDH